jgi:hypothetical protein
MRITEYTSDTYEGKVFSKEFCLADLIADIKEFDKATVRKIIMEFLTSMVLDLIDTNDYFLFPLRNFGYIHITDISNTNHLGYTYDIFKGSDCLFEPVLQSDYMKKNKINGLYPNYMIRFIGETQKYFKSVTAEGHNY